MEPIKIQDPGSTDCTTITLWELRTAGSYYELGDFLSSRFQRWFPPQNVGGVTLSVDQLGSWRAELARIINAGGVILHARHTSSNDKIVGVAVARPTGQPHEATLFCNGAAYDVERLENVMLAALRQECARQGLVLGKEVMVRKWEAV